MADKTIHFNPFFAGVPSGDLGDATNPYTDWPTLKGDYLNGVAGSGLNYGDTLTIQLYNDDVNRLMIEGEDLKGTGIRVKIRGTNPALPVHVAGSDVFSSWSDEGDNVWSTAWTPNLFSGYPAYVNDGGDIHWWYYGGNPANTHRARYLSHWEGAWVDGYRLTQIIDQPATWAEMPAGTFYADQDADLFYVKLHDLSDPNGHTMELTVRPYAAAFEDMGLIELENVHLRHARNGLYAKRCATPLTTNVEIYQNTMQGSLIESNWSTPTGRLRMINTKINRNGLSGMKLSFCNAYTLGCYECDENNWRGAEVGAANWREAATKFYATKNGTLWHVQFNGNLIVAAWWDRENYNIRCRYFTAKGNEGSGVFWETSGRTGWIEFEETQIIENGYNRRGLDCTTGGLWINSAQKVRFSGPNNLIKRNLNYDIYIANSGRTSRTWEDGQQNETPPITVADLEFYDVEYVKNGSLKTLIGLAGWATPALQKAFWRGSINILPRSKALEVVPDDYLADYLETHGG